MNLETIPTTELEAELTRRRGSNTGDLDAGAARAAAYIGANGAEPAPHTIESGENRARALLGI